MAWSEHGMVCVNQTLSHCVIQVRKTQSKSLATQHVMGTAFYVWINVGRLPSDPLNFCFFWLARRFQGWQIGFFQPHAHFTKDTALSEYGRGTAKHEWISATRHGRDTAWCAWSSLFTGLKQVRIVQLMEKLALVTKTEVQDPSLHVSEQIESKSCFCTWLYFHLFPQP